MEPIKFISVTHRIGNRTILNDISIGFKENKVTAIIGKSGSGKSTLIKLINGLLKPTSGEIKVFDLPVDYSRLESLRKKIGYSIQGVGLFPHLTVEQNILLAGRAHLLRNEINKERLYELMKLVNLPDHLHKKYPYELSGGEQQRTGICRALFLDPPILLMDEPFGSLDPITRFDIHKEFLRLKQNAPRTVLLVTHDMREAKKLADEILVINNGVIEQFGPVKEIFEHPATATVKELLMVAEA
jgi:osmoprotectant transport system ATP-binding protein